MIRRIARTALLWWGSVSCVLGDVEPVGWATRARDDPAQRITVSWLGIPRFVGGREGSWIERMLEARFNLEIEPVFVDMNAYKRRKPLMLLGGSVPDFFWSQGPKEVAREVKHEFALELPYEFLRVHAPHYVRLLTRYAPDAWLLSQVNGRNYGLPTFGDGFAGVRPSPNIWRRDWLLAVGVAAVPRTLEEMHQALWKFRHEDPDRNGRKDTFGVSPNPPQHEVFFMEVFGAFGILPMDWIERNGGVVWGGVLPEARRVLEILRQWYAEELIDPDWVVTNHLPFVLKQKFTSGLTGYSTLDGTYRQLNPHASGTHANTMNQLHPGAELVTAWFPAGPDGQRGSRVLGGPEWVFQFGRHLVRDPAKVIRVLRLFDACARDEELFLSARLGQRGVHWDFTPERGLFALPPYNERAGARREVLTRVPEISSGQGYFVPFGAPPELVNRLLADAEREHRDTYQRIEWGIKDAIVRNDLPPSSDRYLDDLKHMQAAVFTQIIRGELPLDAFETFVLDWYRRGGRRLTDEANAIFRGKGEILLRVAGQPASGEGDQ